MIEVLAALVAGLIAAGVAIHQIARQARLRLKLEIYREILIVRRDHADAIREVSTKLYILDSQVGIWADPERFGGICPPPNISMSELNLLVHKALSKAADISILTEQWQIIDRRLDLFRLAMGSASHDLRTELTPFFQSALAVLPAELGKQSNHDKVPPKFLSNLRKQCARMQAALSRLDAWSHDFGQEMQNVLMSGLFRHRVPPREPLDSSMFALRLDRYDELKRHFETATPWARHNLEAEENARQKLDRSSSSAASPSAPARN